MTTTDNLTLPKSAGDSSGLRSNGWLYDYARTHLNLDVSLRYRAVARLIGSELREDNRILEIGAGAVSIGTHLGCQSTAVDTAFHSEMSDRCARVQASVDCLPFLDKSWDVVVSVDMLEHIPPDRRNRAIREMIRVTRGLMVLAVPTGDAAYRHDVELNDYHVDQNGKEHRFSREHVEYGLPTLDAISQSLATAARETGRELHLEVQPNLNIAFRSWFMKLAFHKSFLVRSLYVCLFPLSLLGPLYDRGACYRMIFLARLEETDRAKHQVKEHHPA